MIDQQQREAGRELDAEIARMVFGWVWGEITYRTGGNKPMRWLVPHGDLDRDRDMRLADDDTPDAPNWHFMLPRYSTSVADAWAVVEAMLGRALGELTVVNVDVTAAWHEPSEPPYYVCLISLATSLDAAPDVPTRFESVDAVAETAPVVICRAALKAAIGKEDVSDA